MPPSRREQLELDELLSDIYRGIEALPDKSTSAYQPSGSTGNYKLQQQSSSSNLFSSPRVHVTSVREYELPASSPLVEQHRQELANARPISSATKQPQRSTLKRNTNTPDYQQQQQQQHNSQSLASFVTSTTPDNKRRVRILDQPEKLDTRGYSSDEGPHNPANSTSGNHKNKNNNSQRRNVKYVNTNKLIYHNERNPDDLEDSYDENNNYSLNQDNDDDDIDGVTLVKTYHTTWLDRQLGKASKRRSSKELNERQVKEKAMIEELKRSLKNGVITLRRPFKGKKGSKKETFDDQVLSINDTRKKEPSVVGSGLATIPRNYHQQHNKTNSKNTSATRTATASAARVPEISYSNNNQPNYDTTIYSPIRPNQEVTSINQTKPKMTTGAVTNYNPTQHKDYSSTLPQNYRASNGQQHQLLQSHYRGADRSNYSTVGKPTQTTNHRPSTIHNHDTSPYGTRNILDCRPNPYQMPENNKQQQNLHHQAFNQKATSHGAEGTISSLPSATEVVRTALSRSSSQLSLNQLNKTINQLPESPNPSNALSPTPTQYLKPTSPSLSPSPVPSTLANPSSYPQHQANNSLPSYCTSPRPNSTQSSTVGAHNRQPHNSYGTGRETYQQPTKQPLYSNPHSSLLQHRVDQQVRQLGRSNVDSIKEFNELDSLLKSLGPSSRVQVTPGYTSRPAPPSFGYGQQQHLPSSSINTRQPVGQSTGNNNPQQMYATVQKQPNTSEPFIIDATSNRNENCTKLEQLSEFEPRVDLLPSMEDYQNISKLNPVKNSYWYKPSMSRDIAIALLKDKPQGTFIVRDSSSFQGAFGLAVKVSKLPKNVQRNLNADPSSELIRHFLIEPTSNGVRLKGYANEPVFGSLPALIYQHSLTELALPCKLLIPRVDIEDPNFNTKQKQFFDEFAASKELAKHQPYDRTSPNQGYRKYPGDVYVKNEHRIIFQ